MDGTLYHGERPVPGAKDFVDQLRERGIPFRFLTNNSAHPRKFYKDRLARMGFGAEEEDVLTSTVATVRYLKEKRPGQRAYIIATPEVKKEILDAGIPECREGTPDYVLLTFDTTIDYAKLNRGYHYLLAGAALVATHPDDVCPTEDSYDVDIGPFIRLFESLTGKKAETVGKPNRLMLEMAAAEMGVKPEDVVMVGDRLTTDIKMGVDAGTRTVLVLTGETDADLLARSDIKPTFAVGSVADILPELVDTGKLS
jgi:HAD superfamily hydrolase (TIGR01450 family)